ncbi:DUF2330 domain-containing protein [Streptomyces sp. NPDC001381]|uniref:DUF2330 domain-containing protein n=1 Tax=Streptomyces sp. NPDC001381 TaxID=3364567 RepID=UPI0036AC3D25
MVGLVGTIGSPRGRARRREERWGARARARARVAAVLLALLAVQLGSLVAPAYACACGALLPGDQRRLTVGREVSVVRWDGRQEQIVMSLRVGGDAERAAWIMPVPHRATVGLGDGELFDQLAAATAPVQRSRTHFWPQDGDWPLTTGDGGAQGPPPPPATGAEVDVVGRERLGPFDVARLTATDPAALDDWLAANDFVLPPRLETALRPYVERRWEYVAVKLAPRTAGTTLNGELDPLRLTFAADAPVYPMRLSRLAATPQSLGLYVLAAHRMEPGSGIGGERPRVTFAGRVGASAGGPLGELAAGTPYLTAVAQEFPRPSAISGDHELRRAATDTAFRQVIYEDRLLRVAGVPVWLLTVGGGLAAVAAVSVTLAFRGRQARHAGRPGPRHASGDQPAPPATAPGQTPPVPVPGHGQGQVQPPPDVPPGRRAPVTPPVPAPRPTGAAVPPMPAPRPTGAAVPPMPASQPAVTALPPKPTTRPTPAAVPPMPTARPTPAAVPPRPAAPPPPPHSPATPSSPSAPAPSPRAASPVAPPRPPRPPFTPPRSPAPPKPFTLPVTPRPNG